MGSRVDGVVSSTLASCHMWVEFVVGCRLATPVFLSPEKPALTNSIRPG